MTTEQNHDQHQDEPEDFHQFVTDELYAELVERIEGHKVVGLALWEESLADDEDENIDPRARELFDFDLYLENHLYLEIYAAYIFQDPSGDALHGLDPIGTMFSTLIEEGVWLDEIAVTEENELVLILSRNRQPLIYLNVGGWAIEEWETLPDED
ncbi:MAG: hypothetical protein KF893_17060 [Caldilineaceae bacterium]|nr:hypothetical protein [Caldilineaceae bacterium]